MSFDPVNLEVFVFPLPKVTLFPATAQPLNIFEPRYIEMINDAIEQDRPVALCQSANPGTVSGCGRVQLLQTREDGTMLILLRADCKVTLTTIDSSSKPYLIAQAVSVQEHSEIEPGNKFYLHRLMKEVEGWLERNVPLQKRREEFFDQMGTDEERVNTACSLLIEDSDWQQKLLEINDLNERLKTAAALLETSAASH
jgi:Lon protease-like protein